jgi:hypothetical protein
MVLGRRERCKLGKGSRFWEAGGDGETLIRPLRAKAGWSGTEFQIEEVNLHSISC